MASAMETHSSGHGVCVSVHMGIVHFLNISQIPTAADGLVRVLHVHVQIGNFTYFFPDPDMIYGFLFQSLCVQPSQLLLSAPPPPPSSSSAKRTFLLSFARCLLNLYIIYFMFRVTHFTLLRYLFIFLCVSRMFSLRSYSIANV